MDYLTFKNEISSKIEELADEGTMVRFCQVSHVNTGTMECMAVCVPGEVASPTLPVKPYYENYLSGMDLNAVVHRILRERADLCIGHALDCSAFTDRDYVLAHLQPRLIGRAENAELLEETPHRDFLNLAVVYYCMLDVKEDAWVGALIRQEHMQYLNLSTEEMERAAYHNMCREHPVLICTLEHLLEELAALQGGTCRLPADPTKPCLYVVTNQDRMYGSYWITDPQVCQTLADQIGDDFYVLPSSMHECIVLPVEASRQPQTLLDMVSEINAEQVVREERLTNAVFVYERKTQMLRIAAE